jgi:hypothetical protein
MSYSASATYTYSVVDIEAVMRRFSADIIMIAQSTQAITEATARDYAHDAEILAKNGYLRLVDLTLLSAAAEICATQYYVNTDAGGLTSSRPGGVMWPRVVNPFLRITLYYTPAYDAAAREALRGKLKIGWVTSTADTSHSALVQSGGRDYASNGWGMQRRDYGT